MGSHSVTCHPTQVNTPRLNTSQRPNADNGFTYRVGMKGLIYLSQISIKHYLHRY